MIALLADVVIADWQTRTGSGGLLEGISSVELGPVDPDAIPDKEYPALRLTYSPMPVPMLQAGQVNLGGELLAHLFARSRRTYGEAQQIATRLLWSDDKTKGLFALLSRKRSYRVGSDSVMVTPKVAVPRFGPSKGFTFAYEIPLTIASIISLPPPTTL